MKRNWTTRTSLFMVGMILLLINLIGINLFFRLDLTDDAVYSLSDASIEMVRNLDDPVTFKVFFTKDLRPPFSSNLRFLQDKLEDYRAYGGQNIQYEILDPGDDEALRKEAGRFGIPPVQIQVVENDNVQIKNAFMGMAIEYAGKREVIPVIQDIASLEYDITVAVQKLTRSRTPVVGFLTGHGEPDPAEDMQGLNHGLQRNYEVHSVSLKDSTLSEEPDVLMVVAPTDSLPPALLKAIDGYIMGGGKAGFLLNRVATDLRKGQAHPSTTGLEDFLAHYGVHISPDLVMDRQSSSISVQRNMGGFLINQAIDYPFFPIIRNFNQDNQMVNRLREVVLYFASTIDTTAGLPSGVHFQPLLTSSEQSSVQKGYFSVQPMPLQAPLEGGPYVLAGAYSGTFPSVYHPGVVSAETRLVAVGDGDFINSTLLGQDIPGNDRLAQNIVDWLGQDEALLTIRSKSIEPRALEPVSESVRPLIKYFNILGPALLVLLFGLFRWRSKKNRQIILSHS